MDRPSYPQARAMLSQTALHEAAKARARQLRTETMDGYLSAAGRRLHAAWRAMRDAARRTLFHHASPPAAGSGRQPTGAAPCPR